ncbi:MAG: DUF1727 domain-containing protein [Armatimonadetes bacterium]|nr:DUF1727 domain-containing protein [Armatimonadota bacterium]
MSLRALVGITLGKLVGRLSRLLRAGGGTTMPGRVARAVDPAIIAHLAADLRLGSVLVSGTNGKTTTARLIASCCERGGWRVTHNRAGANLHAGVAAALVSRTSAIGRARGEIGVFEVDELALPRAARDLRPRLIVLTNLYRDQLDRYGEIDHIAARWHDALSALGPGTTVLFNADDPAVTAIVARLSLPAVPFGIEDDRCGRPSLEDAADARYCYRCGTPFTYRVVFLSHAGKYACPRCGTARPDPCVRADAITLRGTTGASASIAWDNGTHLTVDTALPGLYNVYNVLAAAAAAAHLGVSKETIRVTLSTFTPAFGRGERLTWNGVALQILLGKNPAGFNELLRTVASASPTALLIAINDLTADGTDVSWLWDVEFEMLRDLPSTVTVSGLRAHDMALRLKYAGLPTDRVRIIEDLPQALRVAAADAGTGGTLILLPTYTAMLQARDALRSMGVARGFWED